MAPAFLPPLTPLSLSFSSMLHVGNSHKFSEKEQEIAGKGLLIPCSPLLRVSVSFCDIPESALSVKLRTSTDRALNVCYRGAHNDFCYSGLSSFGAVFSGWAPQLSTSNYSL